MIEIILLNAFAIYREVSFLMSKRNERKKETEKEREKIKKNERKSRKKKMKRKKIYCVLRDILQKKIEISTS